MEGVQRGNPFGRLHHAQTAVPTRIPHSIKTSFSRPETRLGEEAQLERQRERATQNEDDSQDGKHQGQMAKEELSLVMQEESWEALDLAEKKRNESS